VFRGKNKATFLVSPRATGSPPPAAPVRQRLASPVGSRQATGPRRRARPGQVAGDGQPARLGLLGGTARGALSCSEKLVQKLVGVQDAAKVRGAAPREQRDALGGADAGRPGLPTHRPCEGAPQAEDQTTAVTHPRVGAVGDGSTTLRDPPGAVRPRTRQRLPDGHEPEQWGARGDFGAALPRNPPSPLYERRRKLRTEWPCPKHVGSHYPKKS